MNKRAIIFGAAGVAGLLVIGGGGFFAYRAFFSSPKTAEKAEEAPAKEGHKTAKEGEGAEKGGGHGGEHGSPAPQGPTVLAMDPFVVNLADPGRPRYLKLVVQVELNSGQASGELEALKPKSRDALLMLLSSKTSEEMVTVGGKETLRNEIMRRLNSLLTQGKVTEVYFTEFVVQ